MNPADTPGVAADQGYPEAESICEMVNLDMTREDVLEGRRRVTVFNADCKQTLQPAQV